MNRRFDKLLTSYKNLIATPGERKELFKLIQSDEYDDALLEDIGNTLKTTAPGLLFTADPHKENTLRRIMTALGLHPESPASSRSRVHDVPADGIGGRWLDIAASLFLIVTTLFWLLYNLQQNPDEKYYAGKGIYILPDGTQVVLNEDSELTYFTEQNSRIVKLHGEASFIIEWDAARPFFVQTGKLRTRILGTSFNVRASAATRDHRVCSPGSLVSDQSTKSTNPNPQTIL